jgi:hypothetical protein
MPSLTNTIDEVLDPEDVIGPRHPLVGNILLSPPAALSHHRDRR